MNRPFFLSLALLSSTLLAAAVAPGCSSPGDLVDTSDDALSYAADGTCDGLPRVKGVETPAGVCVGVAASGFTFARGIAELPTGDLVLAEMGGWAQDRGAVWLLHRNADNTLEKKRLLSKIDKPSGVAIGPDGLAYVGTPAGIFRFDPYKIDAALGQPRLQMVIKDLPADGRHPLKKFVFDKQSPWTMYVNIGSASDVCEQGAGAKPPAGFPFPCSEGEGDSARGAIRAYDLSAAGHVASGFTTIARGLRNSMALAVHPNSGLLLQGENSRDTINKLDASLTAQEGDLPHEELNVIQPGSHYGWPYCIDNGIPNPEYRGRVDCANYTNPTVMLPGHVAPLGMTYYTGSMLPDAYRGNLLVTFHGYREYGHRLVMIPADANGVPAQGAPFDIIRGWEKSDSGPQGAPVDVMVSAKDGSIFITEDKNGTVLRVFFDPSVGNGAPLAPKALAQPVASPEEKALCDALAQKSDPFALVERDVIDQACTTCHGTGPGYAGGLALIKCDAAGNSKRLLAQRAGGRGAYVTPGDEHSELILRLQGAGYPQMPAGGVSNEQLDEVLNWIRSGAPPSP